MKPRTQPLFVEIILIAALPLALLSCATASAPIANASQPSPEKIQPPQAFAAAICGKAWLLVGYETGSRFIPLEPEHGTTARLVFKPDGTLTGTTGISTFAGTWRGGGKTASGGTHLQIAIATVTAPKAPNDIAAKFDRDILANLKGTRALKTEKDFIQLIDEGDKILLRYIFRASDR